MIKNNDLKELTLSIIKFKEFMYGEISDEERRKIERIIGKVNESK